MSFSDTRNRFKLKWKVRTNKLKESARKIKRSCVTQLFFYFGLMVSALLALSTFEKILNYLMFINSLSLVFGAATIFILRKRMTNSNYEGFKVRPFPVIPALFILVLLFVCVSTALSDPYAATTGIALLVIGYPLYHLIKRLYASRASLN